VLVADSFSGSRSFLLPMHRGRAGNAESARTPSGPETTQGFSTRACARTEPYGDWTDSEWLPIIDSADSTTAKITPAESRRSSTSWSRLASALVAPTSHHRW
jgi:hypothetical protein